MADVISGEGRPYRTGPLDPGKMLAAVDHAMHDVPLSTLDRRYSEQLNRDQHVEFRLPEQVR